MIYFLDIKEFFLVESFPVGFPGWHSNCMEEDNIVLPVFVAGPNTTFIQKSARGYCLTVLLLEETADTFGKYSKYILA